VPHRQLDQLPSDDQKRQGEAMIQGMASSAPGRFEIKKSVFEKRNDALFVRAAGAGDGAMTKGEVGHMHPSDGSLHVIVGAVDARALIKAGWGQAHPLAGLDNRPDGYLMIYAPRTPAELAVAKGILEAAAGHIGGSPCAPGG
jgi:hypothetical protein